MKVLRSLMLVGCLLGVVSVQASDTCKVFSIECKNILDDVDHPSDILSYTESELIKGYIDKFEKKVGEKDYKLKVTLNTCKPSNHPSNFGKGSNADIKRMLTAETISFCLILKGKWGHPIDH